MKTPSKILLTVALLAVLPACSTLDFKDAEPEKYAALDCEQLDTLSESYRPTYEAQLFENTETGPVRRIEETGYSRRPGDTPRGARPYERDIEQDRRSIALARRQKGCV